MTILLWSSPLSLGGSPLPQERLAVQEKIGSSIPQDIQLQDEQGNLFPVSALLGRTPLILALVYYTCPSVCTLILNGLASALKELTDYSIGKDFTVITISFNPLDTPKKAAEKKANYLRFFSLPGEPDSGWRFLTGSSEAISAITLATGYPILWEEGEFIHPSLIIVLNRHGIITRYLYGVEYPPELILYALLEAGMRPKRYDHAIKTLAYCYQPTLKRYGLCPSWIRGGAAFLLFTLLLLFFYLQRSLNRYPPLLPPSSTSVPTQKSPDR